MSDEIFLQILADVSEGLEDIKANAVPGQDLSLIREAILMVQEMHSDKRVAYKSQQQPMVREIVDFVSEMAQFSCGCPESRLCSCNREREAYQTVADAIEDEFYA